MINIKSRIMITMILVLIIITISPAILAQLNNNPQVAILQATVCCEKTKSGLFCQNTPAEECAPDSRSIPTSCSSTSFCKPGFCYDSSEGTCADHTPQIVCNEKGGTWSEQFPPQCNLGCCVLGDQAAFVTLIRCKRLSSFLGLKTNYKKDITTEVQCVQSVQNQQKGACVFDSEFETTCKFTTKAECDSGLGGDNSTGRKTTFHVGKLCSAEELGTNCGPTKQTTCLAGKDEVYFVDTCGNPANIYDASKIIDKEYWANVKDSLESCNPNSANPNSAKCGNCNYLLGSVCRTVDSTTSKPTYGNNICADLNCKKTSNGKSYKHGESWCVFTDSGVIDKGQNTIGSRFYKHICINGEEVLEQCADFRQEECIEDKIVVGTTEFSQAACRVNRWQDCTGQKEKVDCENTDRRDCIWLPGADYKLRVNATKGGDLGGCFPQNSPGLNFWNGDEAKGICAQGNAKCIVTFEKKILDKEAKCKDNCECWDANTNGPSQDWIAKHAAVCSLLGDCGPKLNWIGDKGFKLGYEAGKEKVKSSK